jgi:hypothetical protein
MKLKTVFVSAGCVLCSMVLFPVFAVGGFAALFLLALGAELLSLTGAAAKRIDDAAARAAAMRMCYSRLSH